MFLLNMATEEAKSCDLLDMEFNIGLQIAFNYMKQMNLAEDRQVCDKYIRSCVAMRNSTQLKVKIHRNRFFNYLLKTMKRTVQLQKSNPVYLNVVSFCHQNSEFFFTSIFVTE